MTMASKRRGRAVGLLAQFLAFVLLVVAVLGIAGFVMRIEENIKVRRQEDELRAEIVKLQAENERLRKVLEWVQSVGYLEEWARDVRKWTRPEDQPMVVTGEETIEERSPTALVVAVASEQGSHWREWIRLLFGP